MKSTTKVEIEKLEQKYFNLVWFARKNPNEEDPYWAKVPASIKDAAFEAMADVERDFPQEVEDLKSDAGDWHHGFNSGMLAALRFVMESELGSVKQALEDFPFLDT